MYDKPTASIISSVQFSLWVMPNSLQSHGLQHAKPPIHHQLPGLLKFMSTESVIPSNHLILCHPPLLQPSIFPSIRVFSKELVRIRWPKYWSFSFSISPSNEYSGLISFRMDWLDLLAVQRTLKPTDTEAETLVLWPPDMKSWLIWKDPDSGKDGRQEEKGMTEDEVVGWHHQLNGHEFEQTLGHSEG